MFKKRLTVSDASEIVNTHTATVTTTMRTKALVITAALAAAGIASVEAQSNVYSVNVVGYYNVTVPANGGLKLVGVQLSSTNTTLASLIKNVPDGTQFFKWTGSTFGAFLYEDPGGGGEWSGDTALLPGQGGFLKNNSGTPLTVTFVGEVGQGSLTNPVPSGYEVEASLVPQAGGVSTVLGLPAADGDQIFKWNGTGYITYLYEDPGGGGEWSPSEPAVEVGEAVFSRKSAGVSWVRNFTVP